MRTIGLRKRRGPLGTPAILVLTALSCAVAPARAQESAWTVRVEPMYVAPRGHDQHVLTIHRLEPASGVDRVSAVALDDASGVGYRAGVEYVRSRWRWGVEFFWFTTSQRTPSRSVAAGGDVEQASFEVAGRRFISSNPDQVLFFRVLEDTDLNTWTADLFGARILVDAPGGGLALRLGVRLADFDNDYRAVVGVEDQEGRRMDGSSNYGRMTGPLLGLDAALRVGPARLEAYLGHSVVLGQAELTGIARDFVGPVADAPPFAATQALGTTRDVAIPITEARLLLRLPVLARVSLGTGVEASTWWDVPVPPAVVPEGNGGALHENSIVYFGVLGAVEIRF